MGRMMTSLGRRGGTHDDKSRETGWDVGGDVCDGEWSLRYMPHFVTGLRIPCHILFQVFGKKKRQLAAVVHD